MRYQLRVCVVSGMLATLPLGASAEEFQLLTGVDAGLWPGESRLVEPQACGFPSCAGELFDGDRLAGNAPSGEAVVFQGNGTPFFAPNEFGAMSFTFRRGSVPVIGSQFPLQGIDFLGGPRLDLDGDLNDGVRRLIPITGQAPAIIPNSRSAIILDLDELGGTVTLEAMDITGTSEGGPGIDATVANTVNVLAGTSTNGEPGVAINPTFDTRLGSLTAYIGISGTLTGVYRIESLGYEMWQDTLLVGSPTTPLLGTFQFLGAFEGWYVERDPQSGTFPTLAGEGLGDTLWPLVDTSGLGVTVQTANGAVGGSAVIQTGMAGDDFTATGNGGTGPTALGPYFDSVVVPRLHPLSSGFVYLQAAGFGVTNSADPIYADTVSYDLVIIAESAPPLDGDFDRDGDADLADCSALQRCWSGVGQAVSDSACLVFDVDRDNDVDASDFPSFASNLDGPNG